VFRRLRPLAPALAIALGALMLPAGPAQAASTARPCHHPKYTTSSTDGSWSQGRYIVTQDMWNVGGYDVSQHLRVCSPSNWSVRTSASNSSGDGAVKTYPNVHRDYHNWSTGHEPAISSFRSIRSTFAARSPKSGIYDTAYDIWINGVADSGSTELMIWTHNHRQTPAGSVVVRGLHFSHRTWALWSTGNGYLAYVPNKPLDHGTIALRARMVYLMRHGYLRQGSTLGQVDFGIEFVSASTSDPFKVDRFNIRSSRK
jgi:hypothetical protein